MRRRSERKGHWARRWREYVLVAIFVAAVVSTWLAVREIINTAG